MSPFFDAIGLGLAIMLLSGCGGPSDLAPASGRVQVDGQPLAGGTIILTPLGGGKPAIGQIESDGRFVLSTEADEGATHGEHRVAVFGERTEDEDAGRVSYTPPRGFSLVVEANQNNEFEIDIRRETGWTPHQDD